MKLTAHISLLVILLAVSSTALAGRFDPQIEEIEEAYRNAQDISADFVQTTRVKILDRDVTKRGKFYFAKGGKFRIAYAGNNEKTYVSNSKFIWVFIPGDAGSLVTYEVSDETVPKEALSFLSGFGKLKKEFKVKKSKAFTDLKPGESALYLVPKSRKAHFLALDAKFNDRHIVEVLRVHNKSGNVSTYRFSKIRTSAGLPAKLFTHGAGKATPTTLPH